MAAGPGDWTAAAAGRHGRLRASNADRENVITTLKAAFVQGRLTKDELDERVGRTLVSRTFRELAALTADLPAVAAAPPAPAPTGSRAWAAAAWAAKAGAFLAIGPAVLVAAFYTSSEGLFKWLITIMIVYYMALMVAGAVILDAKHQGRQSGQLPPRPAGRCQALGGKPRGRAGRDLSRCEAHGHSVRRGRRSAAPAPG